MLVLSLNQVRGGIGADIRKRGSNHVSSGESVRD